MEKVIKMSMNLPDVTKKALTLVDFDKIELEYRDNLLSTLYLVTDKT
jgi:hypothetical protein